MCSFIQLLYSQMIHIRLMNIVLLAGDPACHSDTNRIKPGNNQKVTDKHAIYT